MNTCFLVLDCGATNVRVIALDPVGKILARAGVCNATEPAAEDPHWHQWSLDAIMQHFVHCCRQIAGQLQGYTVAGLTVTTFGVDGTLVDRAGRLLYPVISWKCPRTAPVMADLAERIDPAWLQEITGVGHFSFNTLYKLLWLQEHCPQQLEQAHAWLFMSSLINHRLTGELTTDITMAGTSQLWSLADEQFSVPILNKIGIEARLFPRVVRAGECVGQLLPEMAQQLGLPVGLPVISAGHDTQFALFGAGAGVGQPVLSSGTWEILMVRSHDVDTHQLAQVTGSTCELDCAPGMVTPGMQYLASGVLEWVRSLFWTAETSWQSIIDEARLVPPGADGLRMDCQLLDHREAGWRGVTLNTTRAHFYRAALEGLTAQLQSALSRLQRATTLSGHELILVGGGSRNALWNQMKADALQRPVKVLDDAETTVLGAACYGWAGIGVWPDAEAARAAVNYRYRYFLPQEA